MKSHNFIASLLVLATLQPLAYSQNAKVTRANFFKVKTGMTLKQVQEILGPEKETTSNGDVQAITWQNQAGINTTTITSEFRRGLLERIEIREDGSAFLGGIFAMGGVGCYVFGTLAMVLLGIMPIAIALYRSHPDLAAIVIITVFFSWTCIGWWIALIWAVKSITPPSTININIGDSPTE